MSETETPPPLPESARPEGAGCLVRFSWMLLGNALLIALLLGILHRPGHFTLSLVDAGYAAVLVAMIVLRWLDIRRFGGRTASNQPATMAHWRRYAAGLLLVGALLWAGAHLAPFPGR